MSNGWKGNILPQLHRIAGIATGAGSLYVMRTGGRIALALPSSPQAAKLVVNLYQPQRWKGHIFRHLANASIAGGLSKRFPHYRNLYAGSPAVTWMRGAAAMGTVGFLGCNPNHGLRCVLTGIEPSSREQFIAKLGFDASAQAVSREAEILKSLNGRFPGVIRPITLEKSEAVTHANDEAINNSGAASSNSEWALLRLPYLGDSSPKWMRDPDVRGILQQWLGRDSKPLGDMPWPRALFKRLGVNEAPRDWHQRMCALEVRTALLHGDFAVWNLRHTEGGLVAIDWEWGHENAVAGIDLAHGLRQEVYLIRGMKPEAAVAWMLGQAKSNQWRNYLEECGWAGAHEDWLRLGLLHSHFNALNPSTELLKVLGVHLR